MARGLCFCCKENKSRYSDGSCYPFASDYCRSRRPLYSLAAIRLLMSISYPANSRRALAKLYAPYNPVTIFVEDSRITNAYTNVINLALKGIAVIHTVIPLGDRTRVLEDAAKDADPKNFYIVDGDLDLIFHEMRRPSKNTYFLKCYCIENIMLSGADLVDILRDYCPSADKNKIEGQLGLSTFETEASRWLQKLFIVYAIAHFKKLGVPTVKYSVMRLVTPPDNISIDSSLFRERYRSLVKLIVERIGFQRYLKEKKRVLGRIGKKHYGWRQIVSGKDYLLPLLHKRCEKTCNFKGDQSILLARLSRSTDFSTDPYFPRFLTAKVGPLV